MIIRKGEKEYIVTECKTIWRVSRTVSGKLTIDYQVSKELCGTIDELKAYIEREDAF